MPRACLLNGFSDLHIATDDWKPPVGHGFFSQIATSKGRIARRWPRSYLSAMKKAQTKSTAAATRRPIARQESRRQPRPTGTEPSMKPSKQLKLLKQDLYEMLRQAVSNT